MQMKLGNIYYVVSSTYQFRTTQYDMDEVGPSALDQILHKIAEHKEDIDRTVNHRFLELRQEFQGATSSVCKDIKKLKTDSTVTWKSEGNKQQFEHNSKVSDCITQAIWALENSKLDYCKELLLEAVETCNQRNKLVKLADQSSCGWSTVKNYVTNPLADDSDDEKRISKAESKAQREKKEKQKQKSKQKPLYNRSSSTFSNNPGYPFPPIGPTPFMFPGHMQPFRGTAPQFGPRVQGPCFHCGKAGHFRRNCPQQQNTQAGKQ